MKGPNAENPPKWDEPENTPIVAAADLRAVWAMSRTSRAQSTDFGAFEHVCSPGAEVEAVWFRASMLAMLDRIQPGWMEHSNIDKVMDVAAEFPMKRMELGVIYQSPPFDVQEFLKQVSK